MITISETEFTMLTEYIKKYYGINLSKKRTLVEGRLNNYLIKNGYADYSSYFEHLFGDKSGSEMNQIINFLTTNYSYFMREWDHFNFYKTHVLPELKNTNREHDLRIWSAGCSTGEEPYTIAMLNNDYFDGQKAFWDTKVLATDISMKVLTRAVEGQYDDEALEKVPAGWKTKYFNKGGQEQWEVKPQLKEEVIFRRFNLMDEVFPFKKKFHVIFCRNVMIYFDNKTKKELINKFYNNLENGGYLFIGQSESIDRKETKFKYILPSIFKKVV
jgi:chemotaxis protein methyltransferase CheR